MQWWQYIVPAILLAMIAVIDLRRYIIPDRLLVFILCSVSLSDLIVQQGNVWAFLLATGYRIGNGLTIFVPLLLLVLLMDKLLQKETMGGGDIKLMFVVGYAMGMLQAYVVLYMACLIGLVWQLYMQWKRGAYLLPFGPSIAIACVMVALYGTALQEKFFNIL